MSVLSDAAAALSAGSWGTISTIGMTTTLYDEAATPADEVGSDSVVMISFTDDLQWDKPRGSNQGGIWFVGQGHHGGYNFLTMVNYSVATNTWAKKYPTPIQTGKHGYDHNALNQWTRTLYHLNPTSPSQLYAINIDTLSAWQSKATNTLVALSQPAVGFCWFPEMQGLIQFQVNDQQQAGILCKYDTAANTWSRLDTPGFLLPDIGAQTGGSYHQVAKYNDVYKHVWFGGGNNNQRMWILEMDGSMRRVADSPHPIGVAGENGSKIVCDPMTGKFLVAFSNGRGFWEYDPIADGWVQITTPPWLPTGNSWDRVACCAAPTLGITIWVDATAEPFFFRIYKHAAAALNFNTRKNAVGVQHSMQWKNESDMYYTRGSTGTLPICDADTFLTNHVNGPNNPFSDGNRSGPGNTVATQQNGVCYYPKIDLTQEHSVGGGSLKFTIPGNSSDNTSGNFSEVMKRATPHGLPTGEWIGPGSALGNVLWFQFWQKFENVFMNTAYICTDGAGGFADCGGWKQAIWYQNPGPNGLSNYGKQGISIVQNNGAMKGVPTIYNHQSSGATHDFSRQAVRGCQYNWNGLQTYPEPPCVVYKLDEWMEFTGRIEIIGATSNTPTSRVTLWVNGELVVDGRDARINWGSPTAGDGFGSYELTPFHTNKYSGQAHATGFTWIADLIMSTKPIAQTLSGATASSQNQAPVVMAGADQTINVTQTASLNGSVTDDGLGGPLSQTWSKVSGPGNVTFGDASAAVTTATFSAPGTYVLRLTGNDTALQTTDDITIFVNQNPKIVSSGMAWY